MALELITSLLGDPVIDEPSFIISVYANGVLRETHTLSMAKLVYGDIMRVHRFNVGEIVSDHISIKIEHTGIGESLYVENLGINIGMLLNR